MPAQFQNIMPKLTVVPGEVVQVSGASQFARGYDAVVCRVHEDLRRLDVLPLSKDNGENDTIQQVQAFFESDGAMHQGELVPVSIDMVKSSGSTFSLPKWLVSNLITSVRQLEEFKALHFTKSKYLREQLQIEQNIALLKQEEERWRGFANEEEVDLYCGGIKTDEATGELKWCLPSRFNYTIRVFFQPCSAPLEDEDDDLPTGHKEALLVAHNRVVHGLERQGGWKEIGSHSSVTCFERGAVLLQVVASTHILASDAPEKHTKKNHGLHHERVKYSWQTKMGGDIVCLVNNPEADDHHLTVEGERAAFKAESQKVIADRRFRLPGRMFQQIGISSMLKANNALFTMSTPETLMQVQMDRKVLLLEPQCSTLADSIHNLAMECFVKGVAMGGPRDVLVSQDSPEKTINRNASKMFPNSIFPDEHRPEEIMHCSFDKNLQQVVYSKPSNLGEHINLKCAAVRPPRRYIPSPLEVIIEALLKGFYVSNQGEVMKAPSDGWKGMTRPQYDSANKLAKALPAAKKKVMLRSLNPAETVWRQALQAISVNIDALQVNQQKELEENERQIEEQVGKKISAAKQGLISAKGSGSKAEYAKRKKELRDLQAQKRKMRVDLGISRKRFYKQFLNMHKEKASQLLEKESNTYGYRDSVNDVISQESLEARETISLQINRMFKDKSMRPKHKGDRVLSFYSDLLEKDDDKPSRWKSSKLLCDAKGLTSEILAGGGMGAFIGGKNEKYTTLSELKELDLRGHKIKTFPVEFDPGTCDKKRLELFELRHLKSLKILRLSQNVIETMGSLACKDLQVLDLSNNRLQRLPFLGRLTNLKVLNVSNNRLSGRLDIALGFVQCEEYSSLRFKIKETEGDGSELVHSQKYKFESLVTLDISRNEFAWDSVQTQLAASSLGFRTPHIQNLMLDRNPFLKSINTANDIKMLRALFSVHLARLIAFSPPRIQIALKKQTQLIQLNGLYEDISMGKADSPWHQRVGNQTTRWHGVYLAGRQVYENDHLASGEFGFKQVRGKYEKRQDVDMTMSFSRSCKVLEDTAITTYAKNNIVNHSKGLSRQFNTWKSLCSSPYQSSLSDRVTSQRHVIVAKESNPAKNDKDEEYLVKVMKWRIAAMGKQMGALSVRRSFNHWKHSREATIADHKKLELFEVFRFKKLKLSFLQLKEMTIGHDLENLPSLSIGMFARMQKKRLRNDRRRQFRRLLYILNIRPAFELLKMSYIHLSVQKQNEDIKRSEATIQEIKLHTQHLKSTMDLKMEIIAQKFTVEDDLLQQQDSKQAELDALRRQVSLSRLRTNQVSFQLNKLKEKSIKNAQEAKTMEHFAKEGENIYG